MAQRHYRSVLKKALLQFIAEPDPLLAMLKWVMTEMMRIESEAKVGASGLAQESPDSGVAEKPACRLASHCRRCW